jgi:protein-disulfide isomerase
MTTPELRILKFAGESCSACVAMERAGTLEKFVAKHPTVQVKKLLVNDKDGESPTGTEYEKNYKLSDAYGVEVLPTLILEVKAGGELVRFEGACSLKELEEAFDEAIQTYEASKQIPW